MLLDGRFANRELTALEKRVFPQLPPGGVCLDIGANIGNHAVAFADCFEHVHAFEPNAKALDLLRVNAKLRDNITVHGVGLSDKSAVIDALQPEHNLGGTGPNIDHRSDATPVRLAVEPLDTLALDLEGKAITFAKIDVEGFEAQVIKGAAQTLQAHRPVLGMEVDRRSVAEGSSPAIDAAFAIGYTHMYAMQRGKGLRIKPVDRAVVKNYPLLILSMDPLSF